MSDLDKKLIDLSKNPTDLEDLKSQPTIHVVGGSPTPPKHENDNQIHAHSEPSTIYIPVRDLEAGQKNQDLNDCTHTFFQLYPRREGVESGALVKFVRADRLAHQQKMIDENEVKKGSEISEDLEALTMKMRRFYNDFSCYRGNDAKFIVMGFVHKLNDINERLKND